MALRLQLRRLVVLPESFVSFERFHAELRGHLPRLRALVDDHPQRFLAAAGGAHGLIQSWAWVPELRRCTKCGMELGPEEFYPSGHSERTGVGWQRSECRACFKARVALRVGV